MKIAILVALLAALVSAGVVATYEANRVPATPDLTPAPAAAPDAELARRVAALEGRLEEMTAGIERLRKDMEEARAAERKTSAELREEVVRQKEKVSAAESLLAGYTGEGKPTVEKKPEEMDAFAKEVSKGMRQGIREEFRKMWDLVLDPTPEAIDARRRQLKMFAGAFGASAGLDQAQAATLERILDDTDAKAREDLRPIFQSAGDYKSVDYTKVKKVTEDSFAAQNEQFEKEFPKDKADRLKRQVEPIRTLFGAMIDELGKQNAADAPK